MRRSVSRLVRDIEPYLDPENPEPTARIVLNHESINFAVSDIARLARLRAATMLWLDDAGARTWNEFGAEVANARQQCVDAGVLPGAVVVTPGEATLAALAWMFGAAAVGAVVAPLRSERAGEMQNWKNFIDVGWTVTNGRLARVAEGTKSPEAMRLFDELRVRRHPGLILATGGTTGKPKLVLHDLAALLAVVPVKTGRARRTLPLMRFDHIGGLDMAWRALAGGQVLVAPPVELVPAAVGAVIARHQVEVLPATPSFLNLLLLAEIHRAHDLGSLRLVAYGAEPMPAGLLARLRVALPRVEFAQRFGTSETGALPVQNVGVGLSLPANQTGFDWKIVDHELWIRSPARALGYLSGGSDRFAADGWFRTGDLAERRLDGSFEVLGRREELINVGGEKVLPSVVEGVLQKHPQVADCRVLGSPNALLGQVVVAEVVWRGEPQDAVAVKRLLHEYARPSLPNCNLPVTVKLVKAIDTTGNLKKLRFLRT